MRGSCGTWAACEEKLRHYAKAVTDIDRYLTRERLAQITDQDRAEAKQLHDTLQGFTAATHAQGPTSPTRTSRSTEKQSGSRRSLRPGPSSTSASTPSPFTRTGSCTDFAQNAFQVSGAWRASMVQLREGDATRGAST